MGNRLFALDNAPQKRHTVSMETPKQPRIHKNFRLPPGTIADIKALSAAWDISQADVVVLAIAAAKQDAGRSRPILRLNTIKKP